ncbi:hypothetical protein [Lysobacter sp. A378]
MQERHKLASERRAIRKEPSAIKRRTRELAIARKVVDSKSLEREPELTPSAWVAYGYLSALERTELFCEAYLDCYRRYYARYKDMSTAEEQQPIARELFNNEPSEINSFWNARQTADDIGMPYDKYLNEVMEWATAQKNRKKFPRPNQLYSASQVTGASDVWNEWHNTVALFEEGWDDRFFKQSGRLDPPRKRALMQAFTRMKKSTNPEIALANLLGRSDALSEEHARRIAITVFPDKPNLMEDAKHSVALPTKIRVATTFEPYLPPCLGMREDVSSGACSQCNFILQCQKARFVSNKLLLTQTGSSDPRKDKKREQDRIRQQRKRERDRDAQRAPEPVVAAS